MKRKLRLIPIDAGLSIVAGMPPASGPIRAIVGKADGPAAGSEAVGACVVEKGEPLATPAP